MVRTTRFSRCLTVGLVALALTLGGVLAQPAAALAGFGSSPGSAGLSLGCLSSEHVPEAALTSRKAGGGQQDYS